MMTETSNTLDAVADVPRGTLTYRLATPDDLLDVQSLFHRMLRELGPLGHNVLPTPHNILTFTDHVFAPALEADNHGIVLALDSYLVIGATFFTPADNHLEMLGKQAVAHGIYVLPERRGKGVAKRLQALAHARLSDLGYTELVSVVVVDNKAGLASAQAAGAKVTGYFTTVNLQEDK